MAQAAASLAPVTTNRSRHAVIAVFMQMILAVVYSWSVFRGPLTLLHGWSKAQTIMPYRYQLIMVAVGSVIGGLWQDRKGARLVATVGGLMLVLGCVLASFLGGDLLQLVLVYGILAGLGSGFVYVTPIANLVKWFPDKRGMMVGLAVLGSGVSPLFWSPLIERLIGKDSAAFHDTIPRTFLIMAGIFTIAIVGCAQLFRTPPAGWRPAGWNLPTGLTKPRELSMGQMLGTWQFYALWTIYLLGTSVGLTAIGQASPLIQEMSHTSAPISAGVAVGLMGLFNAGGRLSWGTISDRIGRKFTLLGMSAVSILACLGFLRSASGFWGVLTGLCLAAFAYGGYLALMPAFSADYYGQSNVGGNYGLLFMAWGVCGFLVPGYFEAILDRAREAGNLAVGYQDVYLKLAIFALVVALLASLLRAPRAAPAER